MSNFQPTRFGKYLLLEKLATGGMAQLYRAKIIGVEGFEKFIAIKQILPHLAHEEELITSFIDEAKLAALLNHQNVVQIYDFGSMENSYFITMEFLHGKDLRAVNAKAKEKGTPVSLENALYLISKVCAGLDYAHKLKDFQGKSLHIIHRDISPQNIFLTYEGDVKIVDFGIAKAASQSTITQVGMIKGKVAYMSPEQAAGKVIDHRSDIFATGILLYELIAGGRMFKGDDTLQILSKVREAEFTPLGTLKGGLPEKLYDIVSKALAKDPEDRYQSCADMQADIEECIFRLNLRPSGRSLAEYLKLLFAEEIAVEGKRMADAAGAGAASDRAQEAEAERRSIDATPRAEAARPEDGARPPVESGPEGGHDRRPSRQRGGRKASWPPSRAWPCWPCSVEGITSWGRGRVRPGRPPPPRLPRRRPRLRPRPRHRRRHRPLPLRRRPRRLRRWCRKPSGSSSRTRRTRRLFSCRRSRRIPEASRGISSSDMPT